MVIAKKVTTTKSNSHAETRRLLQQIADSNTKSMEKMAFQNEQLLKELAVVQRDMDEMKLALTRLKPAKSSVRRGLFGRRRPSISVVEEMETKPKLSLPIEELLPLLPQLGGVIPQLNNPKVKETMKILGNPAVMGMIQHFLANGGLTGKAKSIQPYRY